jgi:hypothetical protein
LPHRRIPPKRYRRLAAIIQTRQPMPGPRGICGLSRAGGIRPSIHGVSPCGLKK